MELNHQRVVISLEDSDKEVVLLIDETRDVITIDDSDEDLQICEPFETKKRKGNEKGVGKTRRQRDYEMLADLSDYPYLAAMLAADKIWRENRKKKNKKKRNKKKRKMESQAQNPQADFTEEGIQAHPDETVKAIAFTACDDGRLVEVNDHSSLTLEKDAVTTNMGSSDGLIVLTKVVVGEELTRSRAQESEANTTEEEEEIQAHLDETVKAIIAFTACDYGRLAEVTDRSSLSLEKDVVATNMGSLDALIVPTKAVVGDELTRSRAQESEANTTEEEIHARHDETVKAIAFTACDDGRLAEATAHSSLSLGKDVVTTNMGSSDGVPDIVLPKAVVSEELARSQAQESEVAIADEEKQLASSKDEETKISLETKSVETTENIVLQKLLRGPRYFDHPESSSGMCFSCGADDHAAVNCIMKKQKKPCYICGDLEHIAKHCKQRNVCSICGGRGHLNKDCKEHPANCGSSKVCLRCANSGHDMFFCNNDYSPEDLKEIQCYVCKAFGHLCCAEVVNEGPRQVSCYHCGESSHLGSGCPKLHTDAGGSRSNSGCFRCGEEGHYPRNCMNISKAKPGTVDLATPERFPVEKKGTIGLGLSSAGELGSHRMQYKNRMARSEGHSRWMHRWNNVASPNLFNERARANVWLSPALSARMSQEITASLRSNQFSSPQYPQQNFDHHAGSPSSQAYHPFSVWRHTGA